MARSSSSGVEQLLRKIEREKEREKKREEEATLRRICQIMSGGCSGKRVGESFEIGRMLYAKYYHEGLSIKITVLFRFR